jgi:hypothetical protein
VKAKVCLADLFKVQNVQSYKAFIAEWWGQLIHHQASAGLQLVQIFCNYRCNGTAFQHQKLKQYFRPSFSNKIKDPISTLTTFSLFFFLTL